MTYEEAIEFTKKTWRYIARTACIKMIAPVLITVVVQNGKRWWLEHWRRLRRAKNHSSGVQIVKNMTMRIIVAIDGVNAYATQ